MPTLRTADGLDLAARRRLVDANARVPRSSSCTGSAHRRPARNVEALGRRAARRRSRRHHLRRAWPRHVAAASRRSATTSSTTSPPQSSSPANARRRRPRRRVDGRDRDAALRGDRSRARRCGRVSCPAAWRLPRNVAGRARGGDDPHRRRPAAHVTARRRASRAQVDEPVTADRARTALAVPVTYIHGTDDRFIPVRDAAHLLEATPDPRKLVIVRGMGHAFEPLASSRSATRSRGPSPTSSARLLARRRERFAGDGPTARRPVASSAAASSESVPASAGRSPSGRRAPLRPAPQLPAPHRCFTTASHVTGSVLGEHPRVAGARRGVRRCGGASGRRARRRRRQAYGAGIEGGAQSS